MDRAPTLRSHISEDALFRGTTFRRAVPAHAGRGTRPRHSCEEDYVTQHCHQALRCGTNSAMREDPRETMRRLPEVLQLPLTLLTGKPYQGQRSPAFSPTLHVASSFLSLAGGCIVGAVGMACGGAVWLLLPVGWAVTLHGMRNLRMMIFHQAAHGNLYRRPRVDRFVAE